MYDLAVRRIQQAKALDVLKTIPNDSVDLIYVDPPFGTGRLQTSHSGSYVDPSVDYEQFLQPHLVEAHRILKPTGAMCLHLDWHEVHYAKVKCDTIFGRESFLNEVIWAYDFGGRGKDRWPRKHDNILIYVKDESQHLFRWDDIERIPYMTPGLQKDAIKAANGKVPTDVWWMSIVGTNSHERVGYPTQKPVALVERFITALTPDGGLVLDCFAGSGTTGAAALKKGRAFHLIDESLGSITVMQQRFKDVDDIEWV